MTVPSALKDRVARAYGLPCPYCGIKMKGRPPRLDSPSRDHVNPRALGGGPVIMCCRRCNQDKGSLTLREWLAVLQGRNDYRAKTVIALADDLDAGLLYFVPDVVDTIGLAPGLFA